MLLNTWNTEFSSMTGGLPPLPALPNDFIESLKRKMLFILRYDEGRKELPDGAIVSSPFNLFIQIQDTLSRAGERGKWSFSHHSYSGDFFAAWVSVLNGLPGLGKQEWPEGWDWTAKRAKMVAAFKKDHRSNELEWLNQELFQVAASLQSEIAWRFRQKFLWKLDAAAQTFVKENGDRAEIWASSLDWFQEEWGRDSFIALPGLLLSTGRLEASKSLLRNFARREKRGLIPNRIPDPMRPERNEYNSADASLWFLDALHQTVLAGAGWDFAQELWPVVVHILENYQRGTSYRRFNKTHGIVMDEDGLIVTPAQGTWMDADPGMGKPVTPRFGKVVEANALWYSGLLFGAECAIKFGEPSASSHYASVAELVRDSFNEKFWNESEGALFDVVEGDPHGAAIRPNMILAVSHGLDLITPERQIAVFNRVTSDLLTPFGLRTLSPRDSHYRGKYFTDQPTAVKDLAYHQGSAWPWLFGPYADALARVRKYQGRSLEEIQREVCGLLSPLCESLTANDCESLPELFDGDAPYRAGGTRSQAWSVSEVLRVFKRHLD